MPRAGVLLTEVIPAREHPPAFPPPQDMPAMRKTTAGLAIAFATLVALAGPVAAQAPAAPAPFATTRVADNVYVFRAGGHQSMFVVTPEGVIATDPISLSNPKASEAYLAEIRKITSAPIKYVVYSHHHYDHIAGGKPFKDAGATFVAHRNGHKRLAALAAPNVVLPDMIVDDGGSTLMLGGTRIDLLWLGNNHSDNTLVMWLPKEKLIFTVDWIPVQGVLFRDMPDSYVPDWFAGLDRVLALDWDRMIPGHPGPGGRLGTKDDVRAVKDYMTDVSNAAKQLAAEGRCLNDEAMRAVKLPKYEGWGNYGTFLFGNVQRFCEYWGRGM
jgi:glyoxylase-like metal-dependent hydrolase (beta-lactamase superfamily II)